MIVVGRFYPYSGMVAVGVSKFYAIVRDGKNKGKIYLTRKRANAQKFHNMIDARYWVDLHPEIKGEINYHRYTPPSSNGGKDTIHPVLT